jgi:regulator of sigma D
MSLWKKHQADSALFDSDQRIETWLKQRQDLHGQYFRILKLKPFDDEGEHIDPNLLSSFCDNLVDYISAGHFEIFECLSVSHKAQQEFAKHKTLLEDVSASVLKFAKKYSQGGPYDTDELKSSMSTLGEKLFALRMGIEDRLINCYLSETAEPTRIKMR